MKYNLLDECDHMANRVVQKFYARNPGIRGTGTLWELASESGELDASFSAPSLHRRSRRCILAAAGFRSGSQARPTGYGKGALWRLGEGSSAGPWLACLPAHADAGCWRLDAGFWIAFILLEACVAEVLHNAKLPWVWDFGLKGSEDLPNRVGRPGRRAAG